MTRKTQLWALIVASALTAFFQYIIQGSLAVGANPLDFDQRFWTADQIFWGIRSLIESWVVVYLFTTRTRKWYQEVILAVLEIALLALIAFTLGPAFQALGMGTDLYDLLGDRYASWAYAIGAYTSLMMAGAGIAYKIQPFDIERREEGKKEKEEEPVIERPRSEYSHWPDRDREARQSQIVKYVRDHDENHSGVEVSDIWDAVWNGGRRSGSDSIKYADVKELIDKGELEEVNGGNGRRVRLVAKGAAI